jgi:hypothetical protein
VPLLQLHAPARAGLRRAGALARGEISEARYRIYREIFDELARADRLRPAR